MAIKEILEVIHESPNEKYSGLPSDVGQSKKWDLCLFEGESLEEVARVDGETVFEWWGGNIDQISNLSHPNLFHGAFQTPPRFMPAHYLYDQEVVVG